jgi:uncharacterized protein (TIGR03435 family)
LLVAEGGAKLREAADNVTRVEAELRVQAPNAPPSQPTTTPDGYPELTSPGWAGINGHFRFYQPNATIESLVGFLNTQLDKPSVDATGLEGKYAIDIRWVGQKRGGPLAQAIAQSLMLAGVQASSQDGPDIPAGPSLAEALRSQLGLRLEQRKTPMTVVVVDRIERTPTEN